MDESAHIGPPSRPPMRPSRICSASASCATLSLPHSTARSRSLEILSMGLLPSSALRSSPPFGRQEKPPRAAKS